MTQHHNNTGDPSFWRAQHSLPPLINSPNQAYYTNEAGKEVLRLKQEKGSEIANEAR